MRKIFYRVIMATLIIFAISFLTNSSAAFADAKADIEKYTAQINANPNDAGAYNSRGVVYFNLKNYNRAIADYNKAIKVNPNYAEVYVNRGNKYYYLKKI